MKRQKYLDISALSLLLLSLVFFAFSLRGGIALSGGDIPAHRMEHRVNGRMKLLDKGIEAAFAQDPSQWLDLSGLGDDIVIYRYVGDTLQSWYNCFPVLNDNLETGQRFEMISNPRSAAYSPLSDLGPELRLCNFGPSWYLARTEERGNVKVVAGLEIADAFEEGPYMVLPLSSSEGFEVKVGGVPQFKIDRPSSSAQLPVNPVLMVFSLVLLLIAAFLFISAKPCLKRFWIVAAPMLPMMVLLFFLGRYIGSDLPIFSPAVYADDRFFYSLGAHINYITAIILFVTFLFMVRKDIFHRLRTRRSLVAWAVCIVLLIGMIICYIIFGIRSIILNSNISLELYRLDNFNMMSAVIYLVYIMLFTCILVLLQMLQPVFSRFTGRHFDAFSLYSRIFFAAVGAVCFVWYTADLGVKKEQASLEVWAGRVSVNRDISLEMQLLSVEDRIASDPLIASLSLLDNGGASIRGRLSENYLSRVMQEYDVTVSLGPEAFASVQRGEFIAPGSRFVYSDTGNGFVTYRGGFAYSIKGYGVSYVTISIERKSDWKFRGYASILGPSLPGEVNIPSKYSFARYDSGRLITFRGIYAYSVYLNEDSRMNVQGRMVRDGYMHFIYDMGGGETVIFSRPSIRMFNYLVSFFFIGMLCFLYFSIFVLRRPRRRAFGQSYFQNRIIMVVMASLSVTLIAMALVSVAFVYTRSEVNRNAMMTEKINSIQASLSARIRGAVRPSDIQSPEVVRVLEDVGKNTNSDISLYSPQGMVFMTTAPDVFYQQQVESRINPDAYLAIVRNTSRYFIGREKIGREKFYSLYAPLLSDEGTLLAIISSPYTDESYDFETYVVSHSLMIFSLFVFLLMVAMFMISKVLQSMFKPLVEMGAKMNSAGLGKLEYIEYDSKDEISGLVTAYNRMVSELGESSRKLAQAERDKAWSGMARQVAHEIKNPLTPMKLQLQRLIRLKAKGDDSWQDKFDEISRVILDHIDILTDTANEFSTFAKLYTEAPVQIDLPALLQEEMAIFDNHEGISFEYIGLPEVSVEGPKPQLTRVFVNLLNNSVQALSDAGVKDGKVRISLRKSITDGFYDIVFEDNGPGVDDENIDRLFTPNFTTKNGGSGLGLAISRSVLERCGASISYSRSFALGGACFTILYPEG